MRFPLRKRYRDYVLHPFRKRAYKEVLQDINLEIKAGERIALCGENGAGKTTLLKLIGGLLYPTGGEIKINGADTTKENRIARHAVGFVMNEERSFYWRLSGMQNLEFFGALDNLKGNALTQRSKELIHAVGLEEAADRPVATYSSGMKQRLAIARGLLADPEILILDEPTRALDPLAAGGVRELILDHLQELTQKTLLVATHRMEEAEALCQKVCILDNGKIAAYTPIKEIQQSSESLLEYYIKTTSDQEKISQYVV